MPLWGSDWMANFYSGVSKYIIARATVEVGFPVDFNGNASVCCYMCQFFRRTYSTCGLTGDVVAYPQKYVGDTCPLEPVEGTKEE